MNKIYYTVEEKQKALAQQRKERNLREKERRKNDPEYREKYLAGKKKEYSKIKDSPDKNSKRIDSKKVQYQENKEYCDKFKVKNGCNRCGYNKCSRALSFHHKDVSNKKFTISNSYSGQSLEAIKKEIEKCEVLCENCHSIEHFEYSWKEKYLAQHKKSLVERREFCNEYKIKTGCKKCGDNRVECLHFHHIDPSNKFLEVSVLYRRSWEFLLEEVKKCEILCANCHMEFHEFLK